MFCGSSRHERGNGIPVWMISPTRLCLSTASPRNPASISAYIEPRARSGSTGFEKQIG